MLNSMYEASGSVAGVENMTMEQTMMKTVVSIFLKSQAIIVVTS